MDNETVKHFANLESRDADKIPIQEFMRTVSYDMTIVKSSVEELKSNLEQKDKLTEQKIERLIEIGGTYKDLFFLLLAALAGAFLKRLLESPKKDRSKSE